VNKGSQIYNKDNISIFAVLRQRNFIKNIFIIATTHLLFNLNRGDIKIAQTLQTLYSIDRIKEKYRKCHLIKENSYNVNIIFTGDFNSVSNSGVYKLITEGKLNCTSIDYKKVSI
jgi:mRNA deadenylase 3'-5' endonuclease subunit Ccr4